MKPIIGGGKKQTVCMVAYANYYTDARIKNYVAGLVQHGYSVDVFALGRKDVSLPENVRFFAVMNKHWGTKAVGYIFSQVWFAGCALMMVSWHWFTRRYILVHVHNMPDFIVFVALVPKLFGAKLILDIHDTMPEALAVKFGIDTRHPLIRMALWEQRLSVWFADQVLTTNDLHREVLCSHGVPADKIDVIMNVGNYQIFRPAPKKPGNQNGLTLVYHGTIAERLGIDLMIEAFDLARSKCENIRLLLIGEGEFLPTVRRLVDSLGLKDHIQLKGFVPVEELPGMLAGADVGVVATRGYNQEKQNHMLPVKMLEYAAMEIPTIAPRLRVIAHYFSEESALFYSPDDASDMARCMIAAYLDSQRIAQVKQQLRAFNERYNWSLMEIRYMDLVGKLTR